jgi:hypothetical protein
MPSFKQLFKDKVDRVGKDIIDNFTDQIDDKTKEFRSKGGRVTESIDLGSIKNMRYPLHNDDYKATVSFTIIEEKYKDNTALLSELAKADQENKKAIEKSAEERATEEGGDKKDILAKVANATKEYVGKSVKEVVGTKIKVSGESITMYLPLGLTFNDNVAYRNVQLGQLGATMETGMGMAQAMTSGIGSFLENFNGSAPAQGGDLAKLAAVQLGKKIPTFGAEIGQVAQVTGGVTLNPNERAVFDQPNIREFAFNFKMIAKSPKEQAMITKIIKTFRTELYPEDITLPVGDQRSISLGYKFPNKFQLAFQYDGKEMKNLAKIKPCFLKGVDTVFNATSMAMHEDGSFLEVDMTLRFQETAALTKKDIMEGF